MDIEWLGGTCFRLASERGVVLTDPVATVPSALARMASADLVAWSRPADAAASPVSGEGGPFVIDGPCEVEVGGVFVIGVPVPGPKDGSGAHVPATAYCVSMDEVTVCLLGRAVGPPGQEEVEALGAVDVLIVPVGEGGLDPDQAVDVAGLLEPVLILPVAHGDAAAGAAGSGPVERFLEAIGATSPEPLQSLSVSRTRLPIEPQVVLLTPRA